MITTEHMGDASMPRRKFLKLSAATVGGLSAASSAESQSARESGATVVTGAQAATEGRVYNAEYAGPRLNQVAFPLGGIGAGMICLEGTGALSHVSLRNRPDVYNEPCVFAAIALKGKGIARVLEGPVPSRKIFGPPGTGNGAGGTTYGLPRFAQASFRTRFPFGTVTLRDTQVPIEVELTGWSPFEPGQADDSSLPVAGLEYRFTNHSGEVLEAVFSFNAKNFMANGEQPRAVRPVDRGFILWGGAKDQPWQEGAFSATVSEAEAKVNLAWFR